MKLAITGTIAALFVWWIVVYSITSDAQARCEQHHSIETCLEAFR